MIIKLIVLLCLIQFIYSAKPIDGLKVSGPYIVNGDGKLAILRGASRAGTEYSCVQSNRIFDGPADSSVINAMKSWGFNTVRVPLNEQCWLGYNGISSAVSGTAYINAITSWVDTIYAGDMAVIIELHWAAPGTSAWATQQYPMPNQDHSIAFWTSVANQFKNRSYVIFELYNEPYPDNNNWNSQEGWRCWRDGGTCNGMSYQAAGMQSLVTAVRNTGATNIIALGGIAYSNSLAQFLQYKPTDPLNNLVAVWHSYNFNFCIDINCWNQYITPVAQTLPVFATEIGENTCGYNYINSVMNYLDSLNQNYLGWTWNVWNCGSGPALISDESGTPTGFGIGYKNHIAGTTSSFPPTPSYTPGPTSGPTTAGPSTTPGPTTTPSPAPGNTVYTFSWYVSSNNDYWTQLLITPKPPGDVYFDCGYGQRLTSIPTWSTTQDTYILGNTNTACNSNKVVLVYVGGYVVASKSDGTGINYVAPTTVSYTLTWNATANNAYWSQVFISPKPNVPVYMNCGYFAYPTFNPTWSTNQDTFVLGNTNQACSSNNLITVYIGTANIQSKTDNSGTNVIPAQTTSAPTTAGPTSAPTTAGPTSAPTTAGPTTAGPTTAPTTAGPTTAGPTSAPTTAGPTTAPTTAGPTTASPTTRAPTTAGPTTAGPTSAPTTAGPTTAPTTASPTTAAPTTASPTTTSTPIPTIRQRSVSACIYESSDCSGNSTACVNTTMSTVSCNNNDPLFKNSGVSGVQSTRFSFDPATFSVSYTFYSQPDCQGNTVNNQFKNGACLTISVSRQARAMRSIRLTASSYTLGVSLFWLSLLVLLSFF